MTPVFKKLNFKNQKTIHVVNHPPSFENELEEMGQVIRIFTKPIPNQKIQFLISFVKTYDDINNISTSYLDSCMEDAVIWFCYPKASSKKYQCEFNRDTGWQVLGDNGYEGVRQVAIDEDWSALRFKKADQIKKMTRDFAMSELGKMKTGKK